ncbi:MAG: N-acetylmuramoyl-L-alanine amidase [Verrucomicrobiota bacterium]|nr:N-acetylmuramoyl-L-alanine amidase [Verrucomicrobiota bacterium]
MTRFFRIAALIAFAAAAFLIAPQLQAQTRTFVIDAGHGGFDRGGVPGQRVGEKDLTLDVARRLRTDLQARGYRVIMTRDSDVFVPLPTRVAIANSYRNATFVSVHFNSASRGGANGIETYYYRGDSASLAASIHRNVVAGAPSENRGIRRRGYFVLRKTAIPSVLVECGFLTNPTEASYALNGNYRQKLADEIARGIDRQPAPINRPLSRASSASSEVLSQPMSGPDFVRATPGASRSRHTTRHHRGSRSSRHSSSSQKKHSSSSKSKKKSGSSHKKKKKKSSED